MTVTLGNIDAGELSGRSGSRFSTAAQPAKRRVLDRLRKFAAYQRPG